MATKRKTKPKKVPDLVRRQRALDATMRSFGGQTFRLGKTDCLRLFRSHAVAMGKRGIPKIPAYSSPGGAMKALAQSLERLGADPGGDLGDLMDALGFERIARVAHVTKRRSRRCAECPRTIAAATRLVEGAT